MVFVISCNDVPSEEECHGECEERVQTLTEDKLRTEAKCSIAQQPRGCFYHDVSCLTKAKEYDGGNPQRVEKQDVEIRTYKGVGGEEIQGEDYSSEYSEQCGEDDIALPSEALIANVNSRYQQQKKK